MRAPLILGLLLGLTVAHTPCVETENPNRRLTVFGERHSGTNFLEEVISQNLDVEVCFPHGWKHWWLNDSATIKQGLQGDPTLAVVIIIRNPIAWLLSMHTRPFHATGASLSFNGFLHIRPFRSTCKALGGAKGQRVCELAKDVFEVRATKVREMLAVSYWHPRTVVMHYEALVEDQGREIRRVAQELNLEWRRAFTPILTKVTPVGRSHLKFHPATETEMNEKTMKAFTERGGSHGRRYVCEHLLMAEEEAAGYGSAIREMCEGTGFPAPRVPGAPVAVAGIPAWQSPGLMSGVALSKPGG